MTWVHKQPCYWPSYHGIIRFQHMKGQNAMKLMKATPCIEIVLNLTFQAAHMNPLFFFIDGEQ